MRSYSIGILAFIMEGQEHASTFKDSNHKLVSYINNSSFGKEERLLIVLASKYDDLDEVSVAGYQTFGRREEFDIGCH